MDFDVPCHTVSRFVYMVLLQFESYPAFQSRYGDLLTRKHFVFARGNLQYGGLLPMLHHITGNLLPAAGNLAHFYFDIDHA